jgi:putative NADH-flavin reductase
MKFVLFGASGKTGLLLLEELLSSSHEVVAYVRTKASIALEHPNLTVVEGQLNETDKLRSVIAGADACISTLGGASLSKHNDAIMQGIESIVRIMEEANVQRFLYLSSYGAGDSRKSMPQPVRFLIADLMLRVPLADHTTNENRIIGSGLDWTIVRPGGLTNGPKTNKMRFGNESVKLTGNPSISRANVAAFLANQLTDRAFLKQCVWLSE